MNLFPLVSRLSIVDKQARLVPFQPNWAQTIFLNEVNRQTDLGLPVRIISLKARQLGISTVTEAVMFSMAFIYERMKGLIVAHEVDSSQHLLAMTDIFWQTYPFRSCYTAKYQSRNELAWKETGSSLRVATAANAKAGRGRTLHGLHCSEVGFWMEPEKTMLGLRQTVPHLPGTFISIESTANGVGNWFYNTWQAAEAGDTDYVPIFLPWHHHPEYMASAINLPYNQLGNLDSEERALRAMGLSDDRLSWRRWAIKNLADGDVNKFKQEYPAISEEAFIATGSNVFPMGKLRDVYDHMEGRVGRLTRDGEQVRFQPDVSGPLRVFRMPSRDTDWGVYLVAGDPTHTTRGDYACAQVISRRTLEQVAVYRQRLDPGTFAEELAKIGVFYNTAMVTAEVEGPGYATISRLIGLDYPNMWYNRVADTTPGKTTDHFGWRTTAKSKQLCIGWLLKMIVDKDVKIHDRQTFTELRDYVTKPDGGYGPAANNGFDDTVMALAIAVTCHVLEAPMSAYSGPDTGNTGSQSTWQEWGEEAG